MSKVVDLEELSGAELRHLAYLADQARERAALRRFEVLDRPTIGFYLRQPGFPRREVPTGPTPADWIAEDPHRLASIVREMSRFTDDRLRIAEAATSVADSVGIGEDVADPIIAEALRALSRERRHVG